jgi:hypothetical protein
MHRPFRGGYARKHNDSLIVRKLRLKLRREMAKPGGERKTISWLARPSLVFHPLDAGLHQLFHQRHGQLCIPRKYNDRFGRGKIRQLFLVVLNHGRTRVQPHVGALVAEPDEHAVVIVSRVRISRPREIIGAFGRARRRRANRGPKLPQFSLNPLGALAMYCLVQFCGACTFARFSLFG